MSQRTIRIERKAANVPAAAAQLRAALLAAGLTDVTPADAAAASGLPLGLAEAALFHLASRYPARLRVGEAATLRFTFATLTEARGERDRLRAIAEALTAFWRRHAEALKAVLLLVLVPPFFWTLACHMGALASAFGHPASPAHAAPALLALPVQGLAWLLGLASTIAAIGTLIYFQLFPALSLVGLGWLLTDALPTLLREPDHEVFGLWPLWSAALFVACWSAGTLVGGILLYRHWVFGDRNVLALGLWRHVTGTILGPSPTPDDALSDERRLTALIVERAGILTMADLVGLFGWTLAEAEAQMARILLDYGGEVIVTDEGALIFRFDPMLATAGQAPSEADTRPCYEREGEPANFWDAPPAFRRGLAALVGLGLAGLLLHPEVAWFPSLAIWGPDSVMARLTGSGAAALQGFGLYPYLLVLGPILLRWPLWRRARARHLGRVHFLKVVRLAVEQPEGRYLRHAPEAALVALGGDLDVDRTRADGKVWVHFPAFAAGRREAARLRAAMRPRPAEEVAFDTGDQSLPER
ncbi:MAG: hypothetical protein ACLGIN_18505 [Candidatus Sericytochromatia bacterium]